MNHGLGGACAKGIKDRPSSDVDWDPCHRLCLLIRSDQLWDLTEETHIVFVRCTPKSLACMRKRGNPLLRAPSTCACISAKLPNTRDRRAEACRGRGTRQELLGHPFALAVSETNRKLGAVGEGFPGRFGGRIICLRVVSYVRTQKANGTVLDNTLIELTNTILGPRGTDDPIARSTTLRVPTTRGSNEARETLKSTRHAATWHE